MTRTPPSGPRLERMLALVPWILTHPGVTIPELAQRFEIDAHEIERDLELLPMCGLPPYTADRLIDVWVADDGAVSLRLAEYFERPLRLTPAEGIALLAAGRALLAVPGADAEGPLASALDKVEHALGARGGVAVDVGDAGDLQQLREAVAAHAQLEIEYYSFARDEMTTRVVDPARVFHAFGEWYLAAYCHAAGGDRLFRVDRIRSVRSTGETITTPIKPASTDEDFSDLVYRPDPGDLRVKLRLAPEAAWVVENLPTESVTPRTRGRVDVVLPVSAAGFLERLVLGLGPAVEVLDPPEARQVVGSAAARVLARYESTR
ncbi:MAG: WYL domain-containing protein [Acidimicrobiia bacterium]